MLLRALRSALGSEDASATVELAILAPVYMVLTVAVITVGHMVLIRQEVVLAARYKAWLPPAKKNAASGDAAVERAFFPAFTGYGDFRSSTRTRPMQFAQQQGNDTIFVEVDEKAKARVGGGKGLDDQNARSLAVVMLNDQPRLRADGENGPKLLWSEAKARFEYRPGWFPGFFGRTTAVSPRATSHVMLRRDNGERKVYREQGGEPYIVTDRHPIEDFAGANAFQISLEMGNRFFPPTAPDRNNTLENGFQNLEPGNIGEGNGRDPGIWDVNFRLGGSVQREHQFYRQKLLGN